MKLLKLYANVLKVASLCPHGQLQLPHDFFDDYYIRGYFTAWFDYIKDFAYGGGGLVNAKGGRFLTCRF